jgi:hypothetical protein
MANLILRSDAVNFSAVGSWYSCGVVTGQPQIAGVLSTLLTTTVLYSSTWTGDSGTYDGVLVQVLSRSASPSGTFRLVVRKTNSPASDVAGSVVTVNVADLPLNGGWVFLKFSGTIGPLTSGNSYAIGLSTSASSQVTMVRNGTASNWNRLLRLVTSPGSLAAADRFWICGEKTGAGTQNTRKAFIDTTAGVDYGPIDIGSGGTLESLTAASTNYILRTVGVLTISEGGTLNMGTSGTRMPSTSSCEIQLGSTSLGADGTAGIECRGTWNAYGATKTFDRTKLTADEAAGSTSLDVADNTGWASGDLIAIAATVRVDTDQQCEARTLTGAGTTSLPVGATAFAHQGTDDVKGEVVLLTRNVRVRATQQGTHVTPTTGVVGYVRLYPTAVFNASWASFADLGTTVPGKRGIEIETTTGSATFDRCSFYGFSSNGLFLSGAGVANVSITNCVTFNFVGRTAAPAGSGNGLTIPQTTGVGTITITGNVFLQRVSSSAIHNVILGDLVTFDSNTIVGGFYGLAVTRANNPTAWTVTGLVIHNSRRAGIIFQSQVKNLTFTNTTIYRASSADATSQGGICILQPGGSLMGITFNGTGLAGGKGLILFGCYDNIKMYGTQCSVGSFVVENASIDGDSKTGGGAVHEAGISIADGSRAGLSFINTTFGTSPDSGGKTTHSVGDIEIGGSSFVQALFENCAFRSTTEVAGAASMIAGSWIRMQRADQTNGQHKTHFPYGIVELDSVTTPRTGGAQPTEKLTPNSTTRLESSPVAIAIQNGQSTIPKVWVKKSGANGTQATRPRIMLKKNPAMGVTADTLIGVEAVDDTLWQQLNAAGVATPTATDDGVFEFVVDSSNVNGVVNCDDWAFT